MTTWWATVICLVHVALFSKSDVVLLEKHDAFAVVKGNHIGTISIFDDMRFAFDLVISSFPSTWYTHVLTSA